MVRVSSYARFVLVLVLVLVLETTPRFAVSTGSAPGRPFHRNVYSEQFFRCKYRYSANVT